MNIFIQLLIYVVVAGIASGLYIGSQTENALFLFNASTAIWFIAASCLCLLAATATSALVDSPKTATNNDNRQSGNKSPSPKSNSARQTGEVKWFNGGKGFGFISCDNGEEIFVHFRSVRKGSPRLTPGKQVEFSVVEGKKLSLIHI